MSLAALAGLADLLHPQVEVSDPARWTSERLGEELWSKQREIAVSVRDNRRTAVKSAHGTGKSFLAARLACWWLDTHPRGEAEVITTAPTHDQVQDVLWKEIGIAHRKGKLFGEINMTSWRYHGQTIGSGRSPDKTKPGTFQGQHRRYLLVILDEAGELPQSMWEATSTLVTGEHNRILAIGNPVDPGSRFARVCAPGSGWNVLKVPIFDTPNFTGEEVAPEVAEQLVGHAWLDDVVRDYGEGSAYYASRVLAEFPVNREDGVVPLTWARQCQRVPRLWGATHLGLDVGAGGDETVLYAKVGNQAYRVWHGRTKDPEEVQQRALGVCLDTKAVSIKVDTVGIGWGIAGWLRQSLQQRGAITRVVGVNVGERSRQPHRFAKLRDELWWTVGRELSQSGGWNLAGVPETTLDQLAGPTYDTIAGRIKVESKDDTRRRLGRSPDEADALLLAFYTPKGGLDAWVASHGRTEGVERAERLRAAWAGGR